MQRKACTKCGIVKPLEDYRRDKRNRDGRGSHCKTCSAEQQRRYREENREKFNERNRRYYEANREKINEQTRRYKEDNREVYNAKQLIRENGYQSRTAVFAVNHRQPWALDEDEFIMDDNGMTVYQKAIHIGRTHASVVQRRAKLLKHEQDRARALRRQ